MYLVKLLAGDLWSTGAVHQYFQQKIQLSVLYQYGFKPKLDPISFDLNQMRSQLDEWRQMVPEKSEIIEGIDIVALPFIQRSDQNLYYAISGVKTTYQQQHSIKKEEKRALLVSAPIHLDDLYLTLVADNYVGEPQPGVYDCPDHVQAEIAHSLDKLFAM